MSYPKKDWQDLPSQATPVTADDLDRMENGIANSDGAIGVNEYSASATYSVGDYCLHDNKLYRCNTTISTAENWTAGHWTEIKIVSEIDNINNNIKTTLTTPSGKNQEITGCAGASGKLNIESGETEQDGEPTPTNPVDIVSVGSNINLWEGFNHNNTTSGITFTSNTDGSIKANGTATATAISISNADALSNHYYITLPKGIYSISAGTSKIQIQVMNVDTSTLIADTSTTKFATTFELTETTNLYARAKVSNGTTISNETIYIKIEKGDKATSYSKYNAGSIDYKVRNRNLLVLKDGTYTSGNLTAKVENGKVALNGTNGSSTTFIEIPLEFDAELELGKQYAMSINNSTTAGDVTNYGSFRIDSAGIVDLKFSTINNRRKITINDDIFSHLYTKTSIRIRTAANLSYNNFVIYPQIEEGDTYNDFVVGKKQIATIPLPQDMELCKIGTYKDYIYKSGNKWYKHKEIGKVVLDGTEDGWSINGTGTANWFYQSGNVLISSPANTTEAVRQNDLCNRYTYAQITTGNTDTGFWVLTNQIRIRYGTEDTIENFTTWLSNNNVILYYVLATPVEEEITDIDTIYYLEHFPIYKEYTNIECINEVKPDMHIDYLYDNEVNNYWGAELDSLAEKLHNLEVGE